MFFYGVDATKKPTAAPLGADNTYRSPFLCPQEESDLRAFFRMSRSAFSLAHFALEPRDLQLLGLHLTLLGERMLRIIRQRLHPVAQLRRMDTQVLRGLHIRHAAFLDQPHSLKLELARKLPSLHDPPPAPSKHLTRCLRNRVQASASDIVIDYVAAVAAGWRSSGLRAGRAFKHTDSRYIGKFHRFWLGKRVG